MELTSPEAFKLLAEHIGHSIKMVGYGPGAKPPWHNVSVECETCGCVITDWEPTDPKHGPVETTYGYSEVFASKARTLRAEKNIKRRVIKFLGANREHHQALLEGLKRKQKGLKSVAGNNHLWLQRARSIASDIYKKKGSVTTDDVKDYILRHQLPHPSHPNAWGAIFHAKGWKPIGRTKSKFSAAHAREIRVWMNDQIELPFVTIEGEDPEPFV
jgi:hypothetical protein